jgi:uncharacterized protein
VERAVSGAVLLVAGGLVAAGLVAGALNAAGGGGTFVALPALVAAGVPAVTANAASMVALLPGALVAAWAYRRDVLPVGSVPPAALAAASATGGGAGAVLLLGLPAAAFDAVLPWLLGLATLVLAARGPLTRRAGGRRLGTGPLLAGQFVLAGYGGFFGGAVGILLVAFWGVAAGVDTALGNPARVAQLGVIWSAAAAVFLLTGAVRDHPLPVLAVLGGALLGGAAGARVVGRLDPRLLRAVVLATAATTTVLYAVR